MLVDLGRNDVGKVAQMGSVNVETFMEVERYSHVMHISSTVKGQLLPELNAWDVMRAALPAGTVSGAPKVSTLHIHMQLITVCRVQHVCTACKYNHAAHRNITTCLEFREENSKPLNPKHSFAVRPTLTSTVGHQVLIVTSQTCYLS